MKIRINLNLIILQSDDFEEIENRSGEMMDEAIKGIDKEYKKISNKKRHSSKVTKKMETK